MYTPTEQRVIDLLSDGLPHRNREVANTIGDEHTSLKSVRVCICRIRRKLPISQDIVCVYRDKSYYYQHIIRLRNDE